MEKYGWNGILPQFDTIPWGLLEPDSWRKVGWRNDKGRRCCTKNQLSVGFSTENSQTIL